MVWIQDLIERNTPRGVIVIFQINRILEAFCKLTSENNSSLLNIPLYFSTCLLLSHFEERAEPGDFRP